MLTEKLKSKKLKTYYYLDKEFHWVYLRYVEIEAYRNSSFHTFVYHMNGCSNVNEADHPRACAGRKGVVCSGCGVEVPMDIQNSAQGLWMMEKTKYGG